MSEYHFQPDYAIPPGETLQEELTSRGMTQAELADRTSMAKKTINEIVKGKAPITPETALKLEHVFGLPAHFWNALEQNYRETKARLDEQDRLQEDLSWFQQFPVQEMIKFGWLRRCQSKVEQFQELLTFFGVSSTSAWQTVWENPQTAYRQSQCVTVHREAISAWLRQGERVGHQLDCAPYRESQFRKSLKRIRELTRETPTIFVPQLQELCAEAGVAVVFVRELPRTGISGATRWLNTNKALIQLSLRYKSNDHLWFTFFHEAGHIVKHGKEIFLEINGNGLDGEKEEEANQFACNELIPPEHWHEFLETFDHSVVEVCRFAKKINIDPGIVVGRLQHEKVWGHEKGNKLKVRLVWSDETITT